MERRAGGDRRRVAARRARRRGRRHATSGRRSCRTTASCSARKLWIGFASRVEGALVVDDGARRALVERATSLLARRRRRGPRPLLRGRDGRGARPRRRGHRPRDGAVGASTCCAGSPASARASSRPTSPTKSSTATTSCCSATDRRCGGRPSDGRSSSSGGLPTAPRVPGQGAAGGLRRVGAASLRVEAELGRGAG